MVGCVKLCVDWVAASEGLLPHRYHSPPNVPCEGRLGLRLQGRVRAGCKERFVPFFQESVLQKTAGGATFPSIEQASSKAKAHEHSAVRACVRSTHT